MKMVEKFAKLLDNQFNIAGFKFGLDPIMGLVPVLGDIIPLLLSSYLVVLAIEAKIPTATIIKMICYVILDFLLGSVPIIGDIIDFFFKASTMNLKLLKDELAKEVNHGQVIND